MGGVAGVRGLALGMAQQLHADGSAVLADDGKD